MANESSSNGSPMSDFITASPPPPSLSQQSSDDAESLPSSEPPPQPSQSSPLPSPSTSPPPPEISSPPPTVPPPKKSPPPAPENSPPPPTPVHSPPPPTPSTSPPPTPSTSPPPPLSPSPPPPDQSSPPPKRSPPPPSPRRSAPPPSLTPPPRSQPSPSPSPPPPQPSLSPPPPSPQSYVPPPQFLRPSTPTAIPPSPVFRITTPPPPLQTAPASTPHSQLRPPPGILPAIPPILHMSAPQKSNLPPVSPSSSGNNSTGQIVGLALVGVFIIAFLAMVIFFLLRNKRENNYSSPSPGKSNIRGAGTPGDVHYFVEEPGFGNGAQQGGMHIRSPSDPALSGGQLVFTYEKIAEITNGFSSENIIGEGGFGYVYKASMPDGRVGALKMLKAGSGQGEREFRAEVDIISRIHHRHLVSLIGYCISEQQRALIYEFVPNGNLNQHLQGSEFPVLDWSKRMKITIGAARGLTYLHDGCNPKIIHRDIKSANILLDNAYEAQVADFGLAKLTDDANTHVSTRVMGTFGYMAPEYATSGKLTDRSDVFSFGVVLLELITGRKPVDPMQPLGEESLVEWARPLLLRALETGEFGELVDPKLQQQYIDKEMSKMIEAAAACVRHSALKRPRMVQVLRSLDNGDQLYDLSNGVRYGQSTVYNSGQYNEDIARFRKMVNGSFDDSEFDNLSSEFRSTVSREMVELNSASISHSPRNSDSQFKVFHHQRSQTQNRS
ncbi:hypothetical protein LR48_Vigan06g099500 [Vigna angularis]|uniref:non-specific serine/threonine protein kinase n=2 Tax=Phaseolus angularis TaxID=3914 RepID=A0A0L9UT14_PHAAN|nr:proline-rich receptor-like protein kinase PERK13 [Vigna angularis]KOM45689.1 hypothetical protein LR48_Vigan06g099500 [Vigna angularis]BAT99533.1 hypothetical protein VIGAN_10098200 [Vigna angularis var. angularis]